MLMKKLIAPLCAGLLVVSGAGSALAQPGQINTSVTAADSESSRSALSGASESELTYVGLMSGASVAEAGIKGYGHGESLKPEEERAWAQILQELHGAGFDFDQFNSEVRSGNPMKVEAALTEGGQVLADHLLERHETVAASDASPQACGPTFCVAGIVLVAVSTVAAAINYAGGVNVAVYAAVWTWTVGPDASPGEKLDYQNAVAEITTDLAGGAGQR